MTGSHQTAIILTLKEPKQGDLIQAMTHFLADTLRTYVARSGYTPGQLAKLAAIPKPTIVNWLEGRVKRPRGVEELLRLTAVLHLTQPEADKLLAAAGHLTIAELQITAQATSDKTLLTLLQPWRQVAQPPSGLAPFQALADLPTFVGRSRELAELREALQSDHHAALYAIQGMPGVGKTALAARLAYDLRGHFSDGVLWARVDLSDPLAILATFASAYGVDVSHYADLPSRSRLVRELLGHKHALLVLDGVENSEAIVPLLPPTGPCAVLITTRKHQLSVLRRARRWLLAPFANDGAESLALLAQVLGDERVRQEEKALRRLADLLGHLPLALDIAASRLAYEVGWKTAVFVQRIEQNQQRLQELTFEDQSLHLAFQPSYEALAPELQRFFAQLSLFVAEDFSDEAAAAVAGWSLAAAQDGLRTLFGLSLLQAGRQTGRYQLHPLLRDYARRFWQTAQDAAARERYGAYFADMAAGQGRDLAQVAQSLPDVVAALAAAEQNGRFAMFVRGVNGLYHFWEAQGAYEVAGGYLQRAETAVSHLNDPAAQLQIHYHQGRLAERHGNYVEAETRYEAALALARPLDDASHLSHPLRGLGVLAARRGDFGLADAYYKEGLAGARGVGRGNGVSDFLRGLGVQAFMRGDFARAEAFYEEGLALALGKTTTAATAEGGMLWGLGTLAEEQGDWTQAAHYYQQALTQARAVGHVERVIVLLRSLAGLAVAQTQSDEAVAHLQEALVLARQIGQRWQVGRVLAELGELQLVVGGETAVSTFQELFHLARTLQSQELVALALYGLARIAAREGKTAVAQQRGQESLTGLVAIGHHRVHEVQQWLAHHIR